MALWLTFGRRPKVAEAGLSPIFVRPVREQLEHDRLIRFLVLKYKKRFEVVANVGEEQLASITIGTATFFPDLTLTAGKKLAGVVEVESGESVNNLEAMAQWVHFSKIRAPFHLYVPVTSFDVARRLCEANQVKVAELWTYRATFDGFDLVRGLHDPSAAATAPLPSPKVPKAPAPKAPAPKTNTTTGTKGKAPKPQKPTKATKPAKVAKAPKTTKVAKKSKAPGGSKPKSKPKKPAKKSRKR